MQVFEKLGLFYLGRQVDAAGETPENAYLLYDSKDLCTHAVCVGMTGSGKTGLCISLLEEAAIDNIPAIIIDPKGDMGNLLLTFPELQPADFQPWINLDEARKKDLTAEAFAGQQAELWRKGLAQWGQDGERIRNLRRNTDMAIYTPGSSAGLPVSILKSFAAPDSKLLEDLDLLRDRIQTTASGILELLGMKVDPLQSREHILLANIIEHSWMAGKDLDLGSLIQLIQNPPIERIGVFDLESFYPAKERFKLSMTLNNLLAAPGFQSWLEGEALDVGSMLYTPSGTPRTSIFSIAHLSDAERMFFVTLLLNQILGWMRTQSGTTSLRAILYMDEVFGFLPPIGEPPSKRPLLTLLKQARAFGLGVVLATQNPVDLDYKGLSNTGTWFIGRLQTEQDKERLADGLASAKSGGLDKKALMERISTLDKREFLLQNVHEEHPQLFKTRWAMSYLCGPLTRNQIKSLMASRQAAPAAAAPSAAPVAARKAPEKTDPRPVLPPEIRQYYAPARQTGAGKIVYHPYLIAGGEVQIFNNRYGVAETIPVAHALEIDGDAPALNWDAAQKIVFQPELLGSDVLPDASYLSLHSDIRKAATYDQFDKQYESFVYRDYQLVLWKSSGANAVSRPGENERDFRIRLSQSAHEQRDLAMDRLKRSYAGKIRTLERQLLTAEQQAAREADQYDQKKMDMAVSIGTTLLGSIFGSRSRSGVSQAARSASKLGKEKRDIERAEAKVAKIHQQIQELEARLQREMDAIAAQYDPMSEQLEDVVLRPKKSDIYQKWYGILWVPFRHDAQGVASLHPAIG
ncbi:MAG: ATP-binding protein [Calditrichae bacterium]|nr:ATP-binding protein [Calditrichia bacterium]